VMLPVMQAEEARAVGVGLGRIAGKMERRKDAGADGELRRRAARSESRGWTETGRGHRMELDVTVQFQGRSGGTESLPVSGATSSPHTHSTSSIVRPAP
jgi:hypothetical protein